MHQICQAVGSVGTRNYLLLVAGGALDDPLCSAGMYFLATSVSEDVGFGVQIPSAHVLITIEKLGPTMQARLPLSHCSSKTTCSREVCKKGEDTLPTTLNQIICSH